MKLREMIPLSGLVLLFLATTGVKGCREEAARTFNPNRAPETYLTAAPIESSTTSYLFHLFWNGTDPDGEVVGFYVAVTDSNIEPHPDSLVYTTRTDTNIAFKVAGTTQTLTHRFYASAVDNEGRIDPSPAWVFFESFDRFFPEPVILDSRAVEYMKDGTENVFHLSETYSEDGIRDTIPVVDPEFSDSVVVYFRWTGVDRDRFGVVEGYRYRITGDAGYTDISGLDTASVNYKNLENGTLTFGVAALDDAGAQTDPDSIRIFVVNFDPDTRFESTFIERRGTGPEMQEIVHDEGDTVAIGSVCVFCLRGHDRDGADEELQYSSGLVVRKKCGGGTNFPFSFFDEDSTGPRYCYELEVDRDPRESGSLRALARSKDLHGRVDGSPATFQFYTNLPPAIEPRNVRLNTVYNITSSTVRATGGVLTVTLSQLEDPDPGQGGGTMEARVFLSGQPGGIEYSVETDWAEATSAHTLTGITEEGRYSIRIRIRDEGCRELVLNAQFNLTL